MGCECSLDSRGTIADTPACKDLIDIFKSNPSEKAHRKAMHTWKDIGFFEIDKHILDSKVILNDKIKIQKEPSIKDNDIYQGQINHSG